MFTYGIRHAEAELESERLEHAIAEVVPLEHSEVIHRSLTHSEFDSTKEYFSN